MTDEETPTAAHIELLEPAGHQRANMVLANGRYLILDIQLEDLVAQVRAFLADEARDFLELAVIEVVGGDKDATVPIVIANPIFLSRHAIEQMHSMSRVWAKQVPGQKVTDADVSVSRSVDDVVLELRRNADPATLKRVERQLRAARNGG